MVWTLFSAATIGLSAWDWGALIAYLLVVMAIGIWCAQGKHDTESYLLGGRSIAWWAVGVSFVVSLTSTLSFVGTPGEAYEHGLTLSLSLLVMPVAVITSFYLFVRFYFKQRMFTPFGYLEQRFDHRVRAIAAALFWLTRLSYLALVLYSSSKVFEGAADWNIHRTIVLVGTVGIGYTILGGIRAVVWTDMIQFLAMTTGLIIMIAIVIQAVPGGVAGIFETAFDNGRGFVGMQKRSFYLPGKEMLYERYILWFILLNPFTQWLFYHSSDQIALQRILSTSNYASAKRAMFTNLCISVPMSMLFYFLGLALFSYYFHQPEAARPASGDLAIFRFIAEKMPAPLAGLMIAALLAAVMSTLDSGINSLSTIMTKDFYVRFFRKNASELEQVRYAKWMTAVVGVLAVATALILATISENVKDSIMTTSWVWMALDSVLPGIFLLAVLSRRATSGHALVAIFCGWVGSVGLMSLYFITKAQGRPISMMLIGLGGLLITCTVGFVITRFAPRRALQEIKGLTIWTWNQEVDSSSSLSGPGREK